MGVEMNEILRQIRRVKAKARTAHYDRQRAEARCHGQKPSKRTLRIRHALQKIEDEIFDLQADLGQGWLA